MQLLLEANPYFVALGLDVENTFNEAMRKKILEKLWEDKALRFMWYYFWRVKTVKSYVGLSSGPKMIKAPFTSDEGEQQGAVESMSLFTLATDDANAETNSELREHGGALVAGADDTYIVAPPAIAFALSLIHISEPTRR